MAEKTIDFVDFINGIKKRHGIEDPGYDYALSNLLVSNGWLEKDIYMENGRLCATEIFIRTNAELFEKHAKYYHLSFANKNLLLIKRLSQFAPKTASLFAIYSKKKQLEEETIYTILDFLCYYLPGELQESSDREVSTLMENGFDSLSKVYGDILADFINWTKTTSKTVYYNFYFMPPYSDKTNESAAYSEEIYLHLIYYLYCPDYIEENRMYVRAAESKNYVDTWLFLALHCICALRNTDFLRFPHPRLPIPADEVLAQVAKGEFSDINAKKVLYYILDKLDVIKFVPNKTRNTSGVSDIKFTVPHSAEVHIGTLFAIAEAHHQICGLSPETPLIRVIADYQRIRRYMGDDIGELFVEANFRSRSANKAFLQLIYVMTDIVNEESDDEFHVKGYILAALARSHKGSYGEYAKTTSIYLKDAKMSGFTPEFVAREMMERGVLSCVADMLLKMTCGDDYKKLSVSAQTKAIQNLNLSPLDAETTVIIMRQVEKQAARISKEVYEDNSRESVLKILHRLGNGEAASKQNGCLCLLTAMRKPCKYAERYHACIGCEYEISTKATAFMLMAEMKRLNNEFDSTSNELVKWKNKALASKIVVPAMTEILRVMEEKYGEKSTIELMEIMKVADKNG